MFPQGQDGLLELIKECIEYSTVQTQFYHQQPNTIYQSSSEDLVSVHPAVLTASNQPTQSLEKTSISLKNLIKSFENNCIHRTHGFRTLSASCSRDLSSERYFWRLLSLFHEDKLLKHLILPPFTSNSQNTSPPPENIWNVLSSTLFSDDAISSGVVQISSLSTEQRLIGLRQGSKILHLLLAVVSWLEALYEETAHIEDIETDCTRTINSLTNQSVSRSNSLHSENSSSSINSSTIPFSSPAISPNSSEIVIDPQFRIFGPDIIFTDPQAVDQFDLKTDLTAAKNLYTLIRSGANNEVFINSARFLGLTRAAWYLSDSVTDESVDFLKVLELSKLSSQQLSLASKGLNEYDSCVASLLGRNLSGTKNVFQSFEDGLWGFLKICILKIEDVAIGMDRKDEEFLDFGQIDGQTGTVWKEGNLHQYDVNPTGNPFAKQTSHTTLPNDSNDHFVFLTESLRRGIIPPFEEILLEAIRFAGRVHTGEWANGGGKEQEWEKNYTSQKATKYLILDELTRINSIRELSPSSSMSCSLMIGELGSFIQPLSGLVSQSFRNHPRRDRSVYLEQVLCQHRFLQSVAFWLNEYERREVLKSSLSQQSLFDVVLEYSSFIQRQLLPATFQIISINKQTVLCEIAKLFVETVCSLRSPTTHATTDPIASFLCSLYLVDDGDWLRDDSDETEADWISKAVKSGSGVESRFNKTTILTVLDTMKREHCHIDRILTMFINATIASAFPQLSEQITPHEQTLLTKLNNTKLRQVNLTELATLFDWVCLDPSFSNAMVESANTMIRLLTCQSEMGKVELRTTINTIVDKAHVSLKEKEGRMEGGDSANTQSEQSLSQVEFDVHQAYLEVCRSESDWQLALIELRQLNNTEKLEEQSTDIHQLGVTALLIREGKQRERKLARLSLEEQLRIFTSSIIMSIRSILVNPNGAAFLAAIDSSEEDGVKINPAVGIDAVDLTRKERLIALTIHLVPKMMVLVVDVVSTMKQIGLPLEADVSELKTALETGERNKELWVSVQDLVNSTLANLA
ncbi:hypothetical protein BLNAU_18630 [Blattamonas nauphoetae]|uniref:Nuclear pore complex protein n=1 Tax=Blattamonas nauphoetae TaxID=2049346 RepID=A0ABQ9X7M6_9EUKA|nr:hypothetical protein BLNAU_18630 [Blattamonas nauphoetae]